jgi:hypothetical protein
MNEVTVSKEKLLSTLRENKAKHVEIYTDAVEGVRVEYRKLLEKEIKKLDDNKTVKAYVQIDMPTSHEEQYQDVIEMLEMSVDDEVTLSKHEFANYVQDKWISASEKNMLRTYALSSSNFANYK